MSQYKSISLIILLLFLSGCSSVSVMPSEVDVMIQDQYTEIINLRAYQILSNLTLIQAAIINTNYLIVDIPDAVPTLTNSVCLKDANGVAFYQARINNITSLGGTSYNLSLDSPLDFAFSMSDGCSLITTNLAVDGSVTPQYFKISPNGLNDNVSWDITSINILFGGDGVSVADPTPDSSDFGVTDALDNGIVLRVQDGYTKNIFNARTNGDLLAKNGNLYISDASKTGIYTVSSKTVFAGQENYGVTIRLDAISNDALILIIQDDLTDMIGGQMIIRGHVVD